MTSPFPPRHRDSRNLADLMRQQKTNARQLGVGFVSGRYPPLRPLGATALFGDVEDDQSDVGDDTTSGIFFENGDRVTAAGTGVATLYLSHEPIAGSLHVRWNGIDQPPTEWSLSGSVVTIPDPDRRIADGDIISAAYAYYGGEEAAEISYRDSTSATDAWAIPSGAVAGDLLVAVGMVESTKTVTANGWTSVGTSAAVTHGTAHSPQTYHLVVLTKVYDGTSTVPTVPSGVPQSVCLTVAFDGGTDVTARFATVADATSADTPGIAPSSLRVWGTLSSFGVITVVDGTPLVAVNEDDIDITVALNTDTGPGAATNSITAGWCLASLTVRG